MLRLTLSIALLTCAATAHAIDWFTVVGDPADPRADTIQIDPVARRTDGPLRTMGIRVSRSVERTSAGGVVFRSYEGTVEFDCSRGTARFERTQFFAEPLWRKPGPVVDFPRDDPRPMAFRLFEPNPNERVIRAACRPYKG